MKIMSMYFTCTCVVVEGLRFSILDRIPTVSGNIWTLISYN